MSDAAAHATITLAQATSLPPRARPAAAAARSLRSTDALALHGLQRPTAPSGN